MLLIILIIVILHRLFKYLIFQKFQHINELDCYQIVCCYHSEIRTQNQVLKNM